MKTLLLTVALTAGLLADAPFQAKVTGHGQPMLDRVRDGIADYIRAKHLDHPVIVGRAPLLIARKQLVITSGQSQARIADTIAAASRQYWDAVGARDFVRVQQHSNRSI